MLHVNAEVEDAVDLGIEDLLGQAILGDAVAHHAAERWLGVEMWAVAEAAQEIGGRQTARSAADDSDLLAGVGEHSGLDSSLPASSPSRRRSA